MKPSTLMIALLSVLLLVTDLYSQYGSPENYEKNAPKSVRIERKMEGHIAKVVARVKKIDIESHIFNEGNPVNMIDGQKILGGDGGFMRSEIANQYEFETFKVYFDGKEIPVDRKLYANCLMPVFSKERFSAAIGDDLQSVFVFMQGSDAAGTYEVIWVLRQDGRHSRITYDAGDISMFGEAITSGELDQASQRAIIE